MRKLGTNRISQINDHPWEGRRAQMGSSILGPHLQRMQRELKAKNVKSLLNCGVIF